MNRFLLDEPEDSIITHFISSLLTGNVMNKRKSNNYEKEIQKICKNHSRLHGDPLEKQFILFPIFKNLHWRLFIVANTGSLEKYDDPFKPEAEKQFPCILHLDSYNNDPEDGEVELIKNIMHNFSYAKLNNHCKSNERNKMLQNYTTLWEKIECYNIKGKLCLFTIHFLNSMNV